jgi:tetratricopeptide (TPR) repeat protein
LIAVAAVGVFGQDKYRKHVWQQIAATCLDQIAKSDNVITACTRMLTDRARTKETMAYIYAHRSLAHRKNNDLSLAMKDIDKAIAIRADISDFWGFRARFSLVIDDHAQFELSTAEAIKQAKSPEEKVFFLTERAWANFERREFAKSYDDCDRVLAIDRTNKDAIYRRIKIRLAQKNYDQAIELLEQAASILPTDSNLFATFG